jgi:hypothetical protein
MAADRAGRGQIQETHTAPLLAHHILRTIYTFEFEIRFACRPGNYQFRTRQRVVERNPNQGATCSEITSCRSPPFIINNRLFLVSLSR